MCSGSDLGTGTVGIVQQWTDDLEAFVSLLPILIRDLDQLDALRLHWRLWAQPFGLKLLNLGLSCLTRLDVLDQDGLQIHRLRKAETLPLDDDIGTRLEMKTAFHVAAPQGV